MNQIKFRDNFTKIIRLAQTKKLEENTSPRLLLGTIRAVPGCLIVSDNSGDHSTVSKNVVRNRIETIPQIIELLD